MTSRMSSGGRGSWPAAARASIRTGRLRSSPAPCVFLPTSSRGTRELVWLASTGPLLQAWLARRPGAAMGRLMSKELSTVVLAVDRIACDGHGICAELLPERIDLDDWGYPILSAEPVTPALMDHARRAVEMCPVLALRVRSAPTQASRVAVGVRAAR